MTRLLSLHLIFVISGIHCNNDNNDGTDIEEIDGKYNSAIKEPISTPEDFLTLDGGKDVLPKLIRLLTDAEYREGRNKALKTMTPSKDILRPRILDDDILDAADALIPDVPISKIHMHHIFPPSLIRPLQRVIIQKMIRFIRNPPYKKVKRKVIRRMRAGTVAVGLGLGVKELKELKSHPPTAHYKVTGLVDLSGQKYKDTYDEHGEFGDHNKRYKRSATYPVEDKYESDYNPVKDYKLIPDKKHYWPFHESKEEIYEKWNKFPAPGHVDPFHHKVKYLHRSFHELQPDLLHLVQDVHGIVEKKTKVFRSAPDLEHPIVLGGQLIKLADSLIPSIRIRIPFLEYLKKSFYEKSKPKVVYVKQPPKVKYVGVPYKEEDEAYAMPQPEPIQVNIPITVPMAEPVVVPEPTSEYDNRRHMSAQNSPQMGNGNYKLITDLRSHELAMNQPNGPHNYDSSLPNQHRYTQMFDQAVQVYRDKKKAKA